MTVIWTQNAFVGVGAGNFLGVQKITCSNFPTFTRKILTRQIFPYKFSVAVDIICFPLPFCHTPENRKFATWNLFFKTQLKICTLGCARTLSETSWLSTLSIYFTVLRFGVPFTLQLLWSERNLTSGWGYISNILYGKMCSIPNTILKSKNTDFLYLPSRDATDMKLGPCCSILDSHNVQWTKHVNKMSFLQKLSSESATHQLSYIC